MSKTVQVHQPNPKKAETVERVAALAQKYPVLAVTSLSKVRASQLMAVRKALRQHAEVFVVKNKLAIRGLQKAGIKNADQLLSHLTGQNALIFSTNDPFKLFLALDKNKVYLAARAGDKAPDDIIVPAGNTSLPAGPVLSEFREAGIQTKIEGGSIWVNKDSVAVKKGAEITPKLASLLSKLNIKPIRAGLAIALAYENGLIYAGDVVAINLDEYRKSILDAYASSRGLAIVVGYVTKETAPDILAKAYREALSLQVEAGFLDKETAPMIFGRAEAEAAALESKAKEKGLK
ncbi:MAG: 50S ribosomal protein L10 [Nitrososphaerota archaeon]|nr:50S ribosomal protein L10 [Nitrososphaerota archaeon]MDG6903930.1 50S ribosomal protein L10 [Nitrososphaerota archaeon]MDG6912703.1 50S ribosomal protein L10 [Nitrososphaerota archaeon]MDG6919157.1 50S ribosomal protein L10 [Nitrososphaerota archaeon]MDG6920561.1 50S ribosomal protein L10 [Nitrososphaerota archaeon]